MTLFGLIHASKAIHLANGKKIIPAEDFSQLLEASKLLEKAGEDAQKHLHACEQECIRLREKAEERGFAEGLSLFNDHLVHFDKEVQRIRHEAFQAILPLALKTAKKIVGTELKLHPEKIVDIVLQALAPVVQNRRIVIYVNKSDKELLETEKPKIKALLEQVETLMIQERSDIDPGGCIIETETGIINASLENQWRVLEAAFEKYKKQR